MSKEKLTFSGRVKSMCVKKGFKTEVKFFSDCKGLLLLEKEDKSNICIDSQKSFTVSNCQIMGLIENCSNSKMVFTIEENDSEMEIVGVELIYG